MSPVADSGQTSGRTSWQLSGEPFVRVPASSANLGPGFDVMGMALDVHADVGLGPPPLDGVALDEQHPGRIAFADLGGSGPVWLRSRIPIARGLGFSGAVRVAGAGLAVVQRAGDGTALDESADEILATTSRREGHGDNVAASLFGGVVAYVAERALPLRLGPVVGGASVVAWVPDGTTSTERSRRGLPPTVGRDAAVHNIGRSIQFALAIEHDDPSLFDGATADRLHQADRLPAVAGAREAIDDGVAAGAWCGWLSGSGPTIALLCPADRVGSVIAALPDGGHDKTLSIDRLGARLVEP